MVHPQQHTEPDRRPVNLQEFPQSIFTSHVKQILADFVSSPNSVYTFQPNLSKSKRRVIHREIRALDLVAKSYLNDSGQQISVYKGGDKKKVFPSFDLSPEAKGILMDLFRLYSPREDEAVKQNLYKDVYKSMRKKDDFFCRPKMDSKQIANNMKSLVDRVEKDPQLKQIFEKKSKLPIASFRNDIISTIAEHQVVLISGETGCGKTTQVPQFLLDNMWAKGESCKIVCTQPRRISATSVAERVSEERGEIIGESVGYKIRLETKGGRQSSILFCTNGIMLRVLVSGGFNGSQSTGGNISELTHIIVDEIHERDRNSDFIIAILRDLLPAYPHLHLVLMSATLDAERFSDYFGGCPIIRIPGFTHLVKSFYLDDVLPMLNIAVESHISATSSICPTEEVNLKEDYRATLDDAIEMACSNEDFDPLLELIYADGSPEVLNYQHSSTGVSTLMLLAGKGRVSDVCTLLSLGADCHLQAFNGSTALDLAVREDQREIAEVIRKHMESTTDKSMEENLLEKYMSTINPEFIDANLLEKLLKKICSESMDGAILVFLPGWDDINRIRERLQANPYFQNSSKFMIVPLHSMVPFFEQKKVFKRPRPGCRKIVLSTNISETSVTIDDVVYVIDSGRMKEKSYDPYNNVSTLQTSWISQASAKQREGRAGRCQPGVCYHLYSKTRAGSLQPFQVPEMRRMPVEELCLQVKLLNPNCKIEEFLNKTLDPPVTEAIKNAITVLQDIGALSPDEQLTELGGKLGSLPVHPLISRMLFIAIMLNCLDPALTLACVADNKDAFVLPMSPSERKKVDAAKAELASLYGGSSDQLAAIAAFDCWRKAKEKGMEPQFCSKYFVSQTSMCLLSQTRKLLQDELIRCEFLAGDVSTCSMNARDPGIVRAILVAGLYPMVGKLKKSGKGKQCLVDTVSCNKVRLHPQSVIYKSSIKVGSDKHPLVVFDEVVMGDSGLVTRNCTAIAPLPLLLLATEIVVAPGNSGSDGASDFDGDKDEIAIDKLSEQRGKIMSSPHNLVTVIVDRWLLYESTALQIAQIYCLRERLSSAILFKVANPKRVLPPELGASIYAIACLFSFDGLSGISSFIELPSDVTPSSFLTSLIEPMPIRDEISNESAELPIRQQVETVRAEFEAMQKKEAEAERAEFEAMQKKEAEAEHAEFEAMQKKEAEAGHVEFEAMQKKEAEAGRVEFEAMQKKEAEAKLVKFEAMQKKEAEAEHAAFELMQKEAEARCEEAEARWEEAEARCAEAEARRKEAEAKHREAEARCAEAEAGLAEAVGKSEPVGLPGTSSEVSSSMIQEPGEPLFAPVKLKSSRKRKKKVDSRNESQPIQASSIVAAGAVGPCGKSSNMSSSMAEEPGKQPLAPVESKVSRKRKRKVRRSESQPIQASSIVAAGTGSVVVDPLVPLSQAS